MNVIGLSTWETVDIVRKGANYGYSEREGNERLKPDNTTGPLPSMDRIPVRINESTTIGTVWYADFKEMLAADDGDPRTMAPIHEMKILWNNGRGEELYGAMGQIIATTYKGRGGQTLTRARVSGGRSDMRLAMDASGELYILSKSDGVIRAVAGLVER